MFFEFCQKEKKRNEIKFAQSRPHSIISFFPIALHLYSPLIRKFSFAPNSYIVGVTRIISCWNIIDIRDEEKEEEDFCSSLSSNNGDRNDCFRQIVLNL